jgi:calcium-dependent protein kinase
VASYGIRIQPSQFVQGRSGSVWDVYTQITLVGKGANGQVYEAVNKLNGERRAVKVLQKRKFYMRQESVDKFMAEVSILKTMDHPNILRIFEFYEDEDSFYLVTEYLTGGELFDFIIQKKQLNEVMAASFMKQLLGAINYCHRNNIVHRDLKPENLIRESTHEASAIKVIDFGESTLLLPGERLNSMLGTAYYIAPEVLRYDYNEKCDIWSCGVILFILLSGTPPFSGRSDAEILGKVRLGKYSFSNRVWRQVSVQAKDLIQRMMKVDVHARISAQQALEHPWFNKLKSSSAQDKAVLDCMDSLKSFRSEGKLRQAICVFIAAQLISKEERDKLTQAFKALDQNHDGRVSREELITGLRKTMPLQKAEAKAKEILANCDVDRSGFIDYTEFLTAGMKMNSESNTANLKAAFRMFDADGSGTISLEELRNMLGPELLQTDQAWQSLLSEADANGDGEIDLAEFQQLVLRL